MNIQLIQKKPRTKDQLTRKILKASVSALMMEFQILGPDPPTPPTPPPGSGGSPPTGPNPLGEGGPPPPPTPPGVVS